MTLGRPHPALHLVTCWCQGSRLRLWCGGGRAGLSVPGGAAPASGGLGNGQGLCPQALRGCWVAEQQGCWRARGGALWGALSAVLWCADGGWGGVQAGPVRGRSQAGRQASLISRPELGSPSPDPGWGRPDWCQHVMGFAAGISRGPCDTAPGDPGLPATFTVRDCGWGRWGAPRQGVECGCLSCCVGRTCGPLLGPRLGGRWPPPPLLRDNGGRGLGLSKAQVSGNVSVLRAPGAGSMGGLGC